MSSHSLILCAVSWSCESIIFQRDWRAPLKVNNGGYRVIALSVQAKNSRVTVKHPETVFLLCLL